MSLKDRFVDGVSSLFDKLNDGEGVSGLDEAELERELAKRSAARAKAGHPKASDNARARLAAAGETAREKRRTLAESRVARIHGERKRRAAAKEREQDAAFRSMAEEARRSAPPPRPRPTAGPSYTQSPPRGAGPSRSRPRSSAFGGDELSKHYETLGCSSDMSDAEIKSAYRKLMRKYHPDLHKDERKKKAATELTTKISMAYAAIEKSRK